MRIVAKQREKPEGKWIMVCFQGLVFLIVMSMALLPLPCSAHQIKQVVLKLDEREHGVEARVMVDAAYCLPRFRGDEGGPAPGWKWFENLSEGEVAELYREAEAFLRESLALEMAGESVSWEFSVLGSSPVGRGDPTLDLSLALNMPKEGGLLRGHWRDKFPTVLTVYTSPRTGPAEVAQLENGIPRDLMRLLPFSAVGVGESPDELDAEMAGSDHGESSRRGIKGRLLLFLKLGFEHILPSGIDHIAFVLGLFFLHPAWRPLLRQTIMFTLGHSLSLAAVAFGMLSPPSAWVEPLIAVSLVWVGVENLRSKELRTMSLLVVGSIGFVHGLGFGNALLNYLDGPVLLSLIGFNLGVELGQITVLIVGFLCFAGLREKFGGVRTAGSLVVSAFGLFLLVERLLPFLVVASSG
jgi:hypothetical protein